MAEVFRDAELDMAPLSGKTVAVLGFGSQGKAQALNLRDSGIRVIVGAREGASLVEARMEAFAVLPLAEACSIGDVIAVLLPERAHAEVLERDVNPNARHGAAIVFAHGFTLVFGKVKLREDLKQVLVAPKAIGPQLRRLYLNGSGAPALIAAETSEGLEVAKAYARALGCGKKGVIVSSFREETETDLFGEQAVLCGGIPWLAREAFEVLVEAGYSPEAAYLECVSEIKLIADMIYERGIAGMVDSISDTAQFGAMLAERRLASEGVRKVMEELLEKIQSGRFAELLGAEQEAGGKAVGKWRESLRGHILEDVHKRLKAN